MSDAVNKPAHYNQGSIECIDAMQVVLTPEEFRGHLKGNVFKYLWREKKKNGIEDLKKAKWYLDRLIGSLESDEQQKASDLQSLKDHPFGKLKEPAWAPKVGDWVRINAPEPGDPMHTKNLEDLDGHILQVVGQSEFDKRYAAFKSDHGSFYVLIDLLKPADQPQATVEVNAEVTGEVKHPLGCPDGWRFLDVGEVIRNGDKPKNGDAVPLFWIGTPCCNNQFILRRNKFEVGEKVVDDFCGQVWEVEYVFDTGNRYRLKNKEVHDERYGNKLAPYIEDAK